MARIGNYPTLPFQIRVDQSMTRILGLVMAALTLISIGLGMAVRLQHDHLVKVKAELIGANARIKEIDQERAAIELAAKLDAQQAVEDYEVASDACQSSIRTAVAAVRIKPIEVPRYDQNGSPNPMCPSVSMRDIQAAGDGPFVPTRSGSQVKARTDGAD
jgi:hypothetical protein